MRKPYYDRIKSRRLALGYTRKYVAEEIYGKTETALANYYNLEGGRTRMIKFEHLPRLAKVLNISLDELFN